jgi:hypothetical protein
MSKSEKISPKRAILGLLQKSEVDILQVSTVVFHTCPVQFSSLTTQSGTFASPRFHLVLYTSLIAQISPKLNLKNFSKVQLPSPKPEKGTT